MQLIFVQNARMRFTIGTRFREKITFMGLFASSLIQPSRFRDGILAQKQISTTLEKCK